AGGSGAPHQTAAALLLVEVRVAAQRFVPIDPALQGPPEPLGVEGPGDLEGRAEPGVAAPAVPDPRGAPEMRLVDVRGGTRVLAPVVLSRTRQPFGENARGDPVVGELGELHDRVRFGDAA